MRTPNTTCSICHIRFYKRPSGIAATKNGRHFCSTKCFAVGQTKPPVICPVCSEEFRRSHKAQKTCSRACSNKSRTGIKYRQGRPKDKNLKVRSQKKWLKEERGARCEICEFDRNTDILVIHHIIERQHGGTDDWENLALICPNCHAEIHYTSQEV